MTHRTPRPRNRRLGLVAVVLTTTAALAGCAGTASDTASSDGLEPVSGGDWIQAVSSIPDCLDISQGNAPIHPGQSVVDNLFDQDPVTGEVLPWLAESYEVSDDGTSFTFHLKDGVTFSDGEEFDAEAVKLNFDGAVAAGEVGKAPLAAAYLLYYEGSTVIDELTLQVDFSEPKASFIQALADKPLGIIAPASLEKSYEERCAEGVIGSGPFVIGEVVAGQSVTIDRREGYAWASPLASNKGEAYLDTVTFQLVSEASVITGGLLSGQINSASVPASGAEEIVAAGLETQQQVSGGLPLTLFLNLSNPLLADDAVRQALNIGTDREEFNEVVGSRFTTVATSVLSPNVPGYEDLSDLLAYDPDTAIAGLEDAGWELGDDGVRTRDGERLSFEVEFVGTSPAFEALQQQWAELGIELVLTPVTQAELTEWTAGSDWDIIYSSLSRTDPDVLLSVLDPDYSTRAALWPDFYPELLEDIRLQSTLTDEDERAALVAEIQEDIISNAYQIPLIDNGGAWAESEGSHGLFLSSISKPFFFDAWIEQSAQ
ncbi:MAG: ABC transporter substrate-binding protein [Microbacterium sp.]